MVNVKLVMTANWNFSTFAFIYLEISLKFLKVFFRFSSASSIQNILFRNKNCHYRITKTHHEFHHASFFLKMSTPQIFFNLSRFRHFRLIIYSGAIKTTKILIEILYLVDFVFVFFSMELKAPTSLYFSLSNHRSKSFQRVL